MSKDYESREPDSRALRYWRSLGELDGTARAADLLHTEFDPHATEFISPLSRRKFLQLSAASFALAGLVGCTRQPEEEIYSYVEQPENVIPGKPMFFATAVPVAGTLQGVLVESHLGRPTKIEGNPDHPASLGASSVQSQASVLELYDPDRSKQILRAGLPATWQDFLQQINTALNSLNGDGSRLHLLTETITSPALADRIKALLEKYPGAQWHQFDTAGPHSAREGAMLAFGRPVNTICRLNSAKVVLALDSDFLACGQDSTRMAREFAAMRAGDDRTTMNRLYSVESTMTPTGGKADHRLPLRYLEIETFTRGLAAALGAAAIPRLPNGKHADWLGAVARDLAANHGQSVVIPGAHQSSAVHALAHAINAKLGNVGRSVIYTEAIEAQDSDQLASLRALAADMAADKVGVHLILGGNPVYDAPADLNFAGKLKHVKSAVRIGLYDDETSEHCQWQIPVSHFLESWGDGRTFDGSGSILQPLIMPLYDSRSFIEILDALVSAPGRSGYDIRPNLLADKF